MLSYDVVIATRNRPDAISLSLPTIINQSIKPNKIFVVDASDNASIAEKSVSNVFSNSNVTYEFIHSDRPNSAAQRNIGLSRVSSPVTMFFDDDSLCYPNVAKCILEIFEKDIEDIIGGVTTLEAKQPPSSMDNQTYRKDAKEKIKSKFARFRKKMENRFFPRPFDLIAWQFLPKLNKQLGWTTEMNAVLVETMAGFKMAFRTNLIKKLGGFDETLGAISGYAQHEDMEMSLAVLNAGKALVATHSASVYHHKYPGLRTNGFKYGFFQIWNMIYITAKYNHRLNAFKCLAPHIRYKIFLYGLAALKSRYERQRFEGAITAWKMRDQILCSNTANLKSTYLEVCAKCLPK